MKNKKTSFSVLLPTLFSLFIFISPVKAEILPSQSATASTVEPVQLKNSSSKSINSNNSLSLTAIPPRLGDDYSLTLKPGEQKQVLVEVRNPSAQTLKVVSGAKDYILGGENGETPIPVDDPELSGKWSLASWLTLDGTSRTLEPKAAAQIPVLISVPQDAIPGGHYAMILHRPTTTENLETTGSQINTQIGTLLYVIVSGQMKENLNIKDFSFDSFKEKGPIDYRFTVENDSSYHLSPVGEVEIKNLFGQVVARLPVSANKNIFPGTAKQYEGRWDKNWGFGPYSATLKLAYGQNQLEAISQSSFWIFPLRIIILVVLVLIVIIVIMLGAKNKKKKNQAKAEQELEKKVQEKMAEREAEEAKKKAPDDLEDNSNNEDSHRNDNDNLTV